LYQEGVQVVHQNTIYTCRLTHTSGLLFEEEERDTWAIQRQIVTPLGSAARPSFFLTERGYQAADHALERAKAILAKSARAIEVSFEGPWETLKEVTTDTTISLNDPRLPNGKVRGKVVRYALHVKGETGARFVHVTLACAVGAKQAPPLPLPLKTPEAYSTPDYQDHDHTLRRTPSGLEYFCYDAHQPPLRERGPLLRHIELSNGPEEQEAVMSEQRSRASLLQALAQIPTHVRLYFRDLRTKDQLEHVIPVTAVRPWAAPEQVIITGVGKQESGKQS